MALLVTLAVALLATARLVSAAFDPSVCSSAPYTSVTACSGEVLAEYYCSFHLRMSASTSRVVIPGSSTKTKFKTKTVTASSTLTTVRTTRRPTYIDVTTYVTAPANADAVTEPSGCDFIGFTREFTDTNDNSFSQQQTLSTGCYCATGGPSTITITHTSNPVVIKTTTITKFISTVYTSTFSSTPHPTFTETLTHFSNVLKQTTPCPQPTTITTELFESTTFTYALYEGVFATYGPTAGAAATDLVFEVEQYTPTFEYCMYLCTTGGIDGNADCTNFLWHPRGLPGCVIQYDNDRGSDYVCYKNPKFNSTIVIGAVSDS